MKNQAFIQLIIASLVFLAACSTNTETKIPDSIATGSDSEETYGLTMNQFQTSNMVLGKMEMATFHEVVKANGIIDVPPENRAAVSCYFGGTVKDIRLLPGEQIKKGQALFVLENPDYVQMQQDYLEAKGRLTYLKSDYERQKNLVEDNVTSQKSFLKAESDYTVTRIMVESLSKKLTLMNIDTKGLTIESIRTTITIYSPINGYITEVAISRGAYLNPSQMAISIVNTDHLHLELNIFEKDLAEVRIGQPIEFRIQEDQSKNYQATVHLVNKTVDLEKRTVGIHGHFLDEKLNSILNPGMYVEADIYTSSSTRLSLPQDALVEAESKQYVLVLQNTSEAGYTFIKREVKVGLSNTLQTEILNSKDFKENAQFLVKGAFNLITD